MSYSRVWFVIVKGCLDFVGRYDVYYVCVFVFLVGLERSNSECYCICECLISIVEVKRDGR